MSHYYHCEADYEDGGNRCIYVPGPPLDGAVRDAVLARLAPAELETVRAAFEKAKSEEPIEHRRQEKQLRKLQQTADDMKYRLFKVDPDNRLVATVLEREYEAALRKLDELNRQIAEEGRRPSPFATVDIDDIVEALRDPLAVFLAPTTSDHDRKLIVRFLVAAVIIEEKTRYVMRARIVWVDGVPDTPIEIRLPLYPHLVIEKLTGEGKKPPEIKRVLDEMGCTTSRGKPWTTDMILTRRYLIRKARRQAEGITVRARSDAPETSEWSR